MILHQEKKIFIDSVQFFCLLSLLVLDSIRFCKLLSVSTVLHGCIKNGTIFVGKHSLLSKRRCNETMSPFSNGSYILLQQL